MREGLERIRTKSQSSLILDQPKALSRYIGQQRRSMDLRLRCLAGASSVAQVVEVVCRGSPAQAYQALQKLRGASEWEEVLRIFDEKYSSGSTSFIEVVASKLDQSQLRRVAEKLHTRGIGNGHWPICTQTLDAFLSSS